MRKHSPIYEAALDAAVHFEKAVAGFSRYHPRGHGVVPVARRWSE